MRSKRGERTTVEIIEAGRSLLLDNGLEAFSLREVARRADLAPSAIYNHFASKDDLVMALAMQSVATLAGYLGAVPPGAAPERLKGLGRAYAAFAVDHPAEYRVIFDCLQNPPHRWESYLEVAHPFSLIVQTCAQGLTEGSLSDATGHGPGGMAYSLWCLVDGHVHLRSKHLAAVEAPYSAMFESAMDALLVGFDAQRGRS